MHLPYNPIRVPHIPGLILHGDRAEAGKPLLQIPINRSQAGIAGSIGPVGSSSCFPGLPQQACHHAPLRIP